MRGDERQEEEKKRREKKTKRGGRDLSKVGTILMVLIYHSTVLFYLLSFLDTFLATNLEVRTIILIALGSWALIRILVRLSFLFHVGTSVAPFLSSSRSK